MRAAALIALLALAGCSTHVTPAQWEKAVALCQQHGGLAGAAAYEHRTLHVICADKTLLKYQSPS